MHGHMLGYILASKKEVQPGSKFKNVKALYATTSLTLQVYNSVGNINRSNREMSTSLSPGQNQ